jgi:hypothetical protein
MNRPRIVLSASSALGFMSALLIFADTWPEIAVIGAAMVGCGWILAEAAR